MHRFGLERALINRRQALPILRRIPSTPRLPPLLSLHYPNPNNPHPCSVSRRLGRTGREEGEFGTALGEGAGSGRDVDVVGGYLRCARLHSSSLASVSSSDKVRFGSETLKSIPESLETLMEKRLLQTAILLVRNLKVINEADMLKVGAVADLRTYLVAQETAVRDILIEELHNHLFLKTFWCDSRWAPYVTGQDALPLLDSTPSERSSRPLGLSTPPSSTTSISTSRPPTKLSRFLDDIALCSTLDPLLDIGPSPIATSPLAPSFDPSSFPPSTSTTTTSQPQNPETDSFAYIETILESLAVLGQLGYVLDLVAQRLPTEIHQLIDNTLDDVTERQEVARRASSAVLFGRPSSVYVFATASATRTKVSSGALCLSALENSEKETDHEILRDLFWTLYSKLDAVLQGMRVIYEVTNKIGSRRDLRIIL